MEAKAGSLLLRREEHSDLPLHRRNLHLLRGRHVLIERFHLRQKLEGKCDRHLVLGLLRQALNRPCKPQIVRTCRRRAIDFLENFDVVFGVADPKHVTRFAVTDLPGN